MAGTEARAGVGFMQRRAARTGGNKPSIAGTVLAWYDRERRRLPWRR